MKVKADPIYGFGWANGAGSIEVPEPFHILVTSKDGAKTDGLIEEPNHPLDGYKIRLEPRSASDTHYGIRAYPAGADLSGLSSNVVSGFVRLRG